MDIGICASARPPQKPTPTNERRIECAHDVDVGYPIWSFFDGQRGEAFWVEVRGSTVRLYVQLWAPAATRKASDK